MPVAWTCDTVRSVVDSANAESMRTIVVTDGGGPSFAQRLRLNDVLKGRPVYTSVVSQSVFVRGIVSALRVFNPRIRCFPPESTEEAFQHVRLTRAETRVVERVIQSLVTFDKFVIELQ